QSQRDHRWTGDQEKRSSDPRFDRQPEGLPVKEERKGAALDQMLGHQADDGLVGIESDLFEQQIDECSKDDNGDPGTEHASQIGTPPLHQSPLYIQVISEVRASGRRRGGSGPVEKGPLAPVRIRLVAAVPSSRAEE